MKKLTIRSAICICAVLLSIQQVHAAEVLIPVGEVIGLQLQTDTVIIQGFDPELGKPARDAGLEAGDQILKIDDIPVTCAEDIRNALNRSDGDVDIHIRRGNSLRELEVDPAITPSGPKLGIYLKEGITGIGTVTYYDPESGNFGALGHGVNDPDGNLVAMAKGSAYRAKVANVRKGKTGDPGQLMGSVTDLTPMAALSKNMPQGVFGSTANAFSGIALPVGDSGQIHPGSAKILSTIRNDIVQEYSVEILKVYPNANANGRNMLLKVTDPRLLETTGGIVQGMSGSPIIQDGKLVGAVTHVLVNDPTTGYGIFIENMLDAAA